jgi:hypothetical protein
VDLRVNKLEKFLKVFWDNYAKDQAKRENQPSQKTKPSQRPSQAIYGLA